MIRWMFLSTLASGLFYGLYAMLLRRDRWLQISRWYLMATMLLSDCPKHWCRRHRRASLWWC